MQVITPGHRYIAANMEDPTKGQTIQFIEKKPDPANPGQFVTVIEGTPKP